MCLVSYTPQKDGYLLCSNRDESPKRSATKLVLDTSNELQIMYPVDVAQGSWIACANDGTSAVLLNGAFKDHQRILPYRMSRGIMLKSFFSYSSLSDFLERFDFMNIEPFTFIVIQNDITTEIRWDGIKIHVELLDSDKCYNWSSCTLYSDVMIQQRHELFNQLLESSDKSLQALKHIHQNGKLGDPSFDFVMNRADRVKTISFTSVQKNDITVEMSFYNFETRASSQKVFSL